MSTRRSTRIRDKDTLPIHIWTPAEAPNTKKKRGAPAAKKRAISKPLPSHDSPSSGVDLLSSLPQEVFHMVLDNITEPSSIGKFGRTCKRYYAIMMPLLHKRIAVAAMFHAHIPKLIRGLEPYLSIAQKKQLKKEGKYSGQQERYPSHVDANLTPSCAQYVRQMVVGVGDPGKKHKYIVHRYVEEAFKNMSNLEIVELYLLTRSIGESLASLENLQALRLLSIKDSDEKIMQPLTQIRNLKHLNVELEYYDNGNDLQRILLNSASTLRSLDLKTNPWGTSFLKDLEDNIAADDDLAKHQHAFTALKSFSLAGLTLDASSIKSLHQAIDFVGLSELTLGHLSGSKHLLFQHLTRLMISSRDNSANTSLRKLCVEMSENTWLQSSADSWTNLESICHFLSSFDTLTTLELKDYNQYPDSIPTNPGLPDMLLQAILHHKNLTNLKIPYIGVISGRKIPYLSATTTAAIIDGLPQLETFQFAPEEAEIADIGKALSHGTNLKSITCFPHISWASDPTSDDPGFNILSGIVNGLLARDIGHDDGKFIWEDYFKLKRISVTYRTWEVASKFGKREKGMEKAKKMQSEHGTHREVLSRDISKTRPIHIHIGFDPTFTWVEKVAADIACHN